MQVMARCKKGPDGLTDRQRECLRLIVEFRKKHGISPTVRELRDLIGVEIHAIQGRIAALIKKGFLRQPIKNAYGAARGLVPVREAR